MVTISDLTLAERHILTTACNTYHGAIFSGIQQYSINRLLARKLIVVREDVFVPGRSARHGYRKITVAPTAEWRKVLRLARSAARRRAATVPAGAET